MAPTKWEISLKSELAPTTPALLDGAKALPLSHFLRLLEEGIMEACMDLWKSVPPDARYFQSLITVSAIGEPRPSESWTSTTQHGFSSPTNHSVQDSSESQSQASTTTQPEPPAPPPDSPFSPILPFDPRWQHPHQGNPYGNCDKCKMPFMARQHQKIIDGEAWPIKEGDILIENA